MRISPILIAILLCLSQVASGEPRKHAEIIKSKELRICYVPWMGEDSLPDYQSPYLEMAIVYAQKNQLTPKVEKILWDDQFKNQKGEIFQGKSYTPAVFDSKKCDLLASSISPLDWRNKLMDMNWIYISSLMVVVRKENKKKFKNLNDLKNKTVAVVPNTTFHEWIMDFQKTLSEAEKMKILEVIPGGTTSYVVKRKADFVILSSHQAMYSKLHLSPELSIAFTVGTPSESGWGFPKGSELKSETIKFFEEARNSANSEVNSIYKKYFGLTLNEYDNLHYLVTN